MESCMTTPILSQGPKQLSTHQYGKASTNPLYMQFMLKSGKCVTKFTANARRFFYKHICLSSFWQHTLDCLHGNSYCWFIHTSHVDLGDQIPHRVLGVLEELNLSMDDKENIQNKFKVQASWCSYFVEDFECSLTTMCCFQRIDLEGSTSFISDHNYFIMDVIISAYKIHNHMTISFCDSIFQHNTSVPVYLENYNHGEATIHLHKHPRITFLAWGCLHQEIEKGQQRMLKEIKVLVRPFQLCNSEYQDTILETVFG